jgi:hypothetical protein
MGRLGGGSGGRVRRLGGSSRWVRRLGGGSGWVRRLGRRHRVPTDVRGGKGNNRAGKSESDESFQEMHFVEVELCT